MRRLIAISSLLAMLCSACVGEEADTTVASPPAATPDSRPNILLIIGDDMGFSDVGAFGSEVATPNIDALAREGLSFTNFHVGATCSPTRSLLLTGVDNHRSGLGNMHEFLVDAQRGQPGYEGHLNNSVVTIATLMRDAGYRTSMAGKWHLGANQGNRPHDRGFDQTYALLQGAGSNYGSVTAGEGEATESLTFTANGTTAERPDGIHSNEPLCRQAHRLPRLRAEFGSAVLCVLVNANRALAASGSAGIHRQVPGRLQRRVGCGSRAAN